MDLRINPISESLNGEIVAPGSKSYSHRAFIVASLADGISVIKNPLVDGDVKITIEILRSLGVKILRIDDENSYIVENPNNFYKSIDKTLDCKNSGTSLRIFTALGLIINGGVTLTGDFLKKNRPILPLLEALRSLGGKFKLTEEKIQIKRNKSRCNIVKIPGDISSQFISALLIVCPLIKCKSNDFIKIELTSPLISVPYVKMTVEVLNAFGINIQVNFEAGKFYIPNDQNYRAQEFVVPGDFSSSSFIIAAAVLSNYSAKIIVNNLSTNNIQGDRSIIRILQRMGADIEFKETQKQVVVNGGRAKNPLKGIEIDCSDIPDLFPILSVVGAFASGKTLLYNAKNLRLKESDRISSMARELNKMGVNIKEEDDRLTIYHCQKLNGSIINHDNDHRIAMACTIAALFASSNSFVENIDIVKDSYPTFLDDLQKIGIQLDLK